MLLMAQSRHLDMKSVLCYSFGPLPWSLATPDGLPRKTNKSALGREILKEARAVENADEVDVCVIDGMALVQKVKGDNRTFSDLAKAILAMALREGGTCHRLDIVFDVYRENSIKTVERENRSLSQPSIQYEGISGKQIIHQWRKFLAHMPNKSNLILFLTSHWTEEDCLYMIQDKQLYVTCGTKCYKITPDSKEDVKELSSNHEEADTRILLHVHHAAQNGCRHVRVVSDDTDVLVLCLAFQSEIDAKIVVKVGTKTHVRYYDIFHLSTILGLSVCSSLIGLHALTGCDSVSAFAGQGKLFALKQLRSKQNWKDTLSTLGDHWQMTKETVMLVEGLVCQLYSSKTNVQDINQLRYQTFVIHKGKMEPHQLPPCGDALSKHIQRANYQAAVWKRSLIASPEIPTPIGHGWKLEDDKWTIDWMDGKPAPDSVLELISCSCRKTCNSQCPCVLNRLKCSELCKLKDCENQDSEEDVLPDIEEPQEMDF